MEASIPPLPFFGGFEGVLFAHSWPITRRGGAISPHFLIANFGLFLREKYQLFFFLKKRPKFAIRKCGEIAPPYARLAKNGQKDPLQNCEKKGARGREPPISSPRAHSLLSSFCLVSSFRFLLSFCSCRLPAFPFFLLAFFFFCSLTFSLLLFFLSSFSRAERRARDPLTGVLKRPRF